jgi:hypothetical protein
MPDCQIGYMPGPGRRELAEALIRDMPDMVVQVLHRVGNRITARELTIDIVQFDPSAYNKPSLELIVLTGPGPQNQQFELRGLMRRILRALVFEWLNNHARLRDGAALEDVGAIVRFAVSAGVNFRASDNSLGSSRGCPGD